MRELLLDLEVVHHLGGGHDPTQQEAKRSNIPLTIAQVVQPSPERLLGLNLKELVKGATRSSNAQVGVEHKKGLFDRVNDGAQEPR